MQIKSMMRCHYVSIRIPKIKMVIPNNSRDVEKLDLSYIVGGTIKWYSALENSLAVSYKTKYTLSYNSAIAFLGIYPREIRTKI